MKQALHGEQSGAVLLIALMMLLLLGLLATANMSSN
ncbi:MAG: Tfp pilus assembly protein PilX, partial [Porticoccaceae bacterium]